MRPAARPISAAKSRAAGRLRGRAVLNKARRWRTFGAGAAQPLHAWRAIPQSTFGAPSRMRRSRLMIPAVIEAWRAMVASRNLAQLESLLSPGATFYSPIVHTPQVGREITAKYLRAAVGVLNNDSFRYVEEWFGASSAVLEFEVAAEGVLIDGIRRDPLERRRRDRRLQGDGASAQGDQPRASIDDAGAWLGAPLNRSRSGGAGMPRIKQDRFGQSTLLGTAGGDPGAATESGPR